MPTTTKKWCPKCERNLPLTEFFANRHKPDGLQGYCKQCWMAYTKAREERVEFKGYRHSAHIRRNYGLSAEQYQELFDKQGGVCALCKQPETWKGRGGKVLPLAVDHDQKCCPTERNKWKTCGSCIRGLLCRRCNQALGILNEDVELLRRMVAYVKR